MRTYIITRSSGSSDSRCKFETVPIINVRRRWWEADADVCAQTQEHKLRPAHTPCRKTTASSIKALHRLGGADSLFAGIRALGQGRTHPIVRNLLCALRAALLEKVDFADGSFLGYRPLGMTEKMRCIAFACPCGSDIRDLRPLVSMECVVRG